MAASTIDWNNFGARYPERPSPQAIQQYTNLLLQFIGSEPRAPIKVPKRPSSLEYQVNCDDSEWWDGKRDTPAKIVDLILFAYELDTLEIRLHELDEVVDEL
jgi:hypothetical protein